METELNQIFDFFKDNAQISEKELRFNMFNIRGITSHSFIFLVKFFQQNKKWKYTQTDDTTITGTPLNGGPEIRCTESKGEHLFIMKTKNGNLDFPDLGIRASLANEFEIPLTYEEFQRKYISNFKRTRTRHSFLNTQDGVWKIDLTRVIENEKIVFECEIECLNIEKLKVKSSIKFLTIFHQLIHQTNTVVTKTMSTSIFNDYSKLCRCKSFIGPLPYAISKEQYEKGKLTCGYTVTDKADGERKLLFVNSEGVAVFITRSHQIVPQFIGNCNVNNTLLDGEYVDNTFYIFDILFYKGQDLRNHDFLKRFSQALKVKKEINSKTLNIKIKIKTFYGFKNKNFRNLNTNKLVPNINKAIDIIQNKTKFNYELDGLVFNPIDEPYYNKKIFKWKDKHTIDFSIEKLENSNSKNEKWKLYIAGFDHKRIYKHFPFEGMKGFFYHFNRSEKLKYKLDIPVDRGIIYVPKQLAEKFSNFSIVEFEFKNSTFVPIITRTDKLWANNVRAVNDAWDGIQNPINLSNEIYYNCGRKYHNMIKQKLIQTHSAGKNVLDIGVGAGGDLHKYTQSKVKHLTGVDFQEIEYPFDTKKTDFFKLSSDMYNLKSIIGNKKFDTINVFFALHYVFKSKETLKNFMNNILNMSSIGGILCITCMNGNKLKNKIKNNEYKSSAAEIQLKSFDPKKLTGNKILVDVKGTKYFQKEKSEEYIINIQQFIKVMKNINFHLISSTPFKTFSHLSEYNLMNKDEKEFSNLHNVLIFKNNNENIDNENFQHLQISV